ncbi:molybdenum cofactor biosynthesis protein MoaE [Paracoccus sp. p3-h83]|uniref:molybdenum cofactor biosynthesis protein MoaE n=1 Tax=Paracoccus sp. p3-h83 TaxID=3342805 RepID=UPI0035BA0964
MDIRIQPQPFDAGAELNAFAARCPSNTGAQVSFTGVVRDDTGNLQALEIEHYPGMTAKVITAMAEQARARWDLGAVLVIHRHGPLAVGDPIMMVATAARHRVAAFEAAEFLMDYLKSRAPFWKREVTATGTAWVEAKDQDEAALTRW